MIRLQAAKRLLKADTPLASEGLRSQKAQRLLLSLQKRRVPATLNRVDFSIGCTVEFRGLLQALELLGWVYEHEHEAGATSALMREGHDLIRIVEPRAGWNPVIQIVN